MGFVDGTENPRGDGARDAAVVGEEDPAFAGGSYVIVQKYLHDMKGWNALPVETQERIIGRKKLSDIELSGHREAGLRAQCADEHCGEWKRAQDSAGQHALWPPGHGEFGTYFIGYSRTPRITETMLQNMFVGNPPGKLRPAAGLQPRRHRQFIFAPSATFLDNISADGPASAATDPSPISETSDPPSLSTAGETSLASDP